MTNTTNTTSWPMYTTIYTLSARGKREVGQSFHPDLAAAIADRTDVIRRESFGKGKVIEVRLTTVDDLHAAEITNGAVWSLPQFQNA